jgi:hypothetical protein
MAGRSLVSGGHLLITISIGIRLPIRDHGSAEYAVVDGGAHEVFQLFEGRIQHDA